MLDQHPDRRRSAMSGLIAAFLVIASLSFAREVLVPLALAGLIAFLLAPPATQIERRGVPKTLASPLVARGHLHDGVRSRVVRSWAGLQPGG